MTDTWWWWLVTWCTNRFNIQQLYWSRDAPTGLTFNNCTLCPPCIYVFCIYLTTISHLCHLQHKLIGFYNRDEKCLPCGTDWVFKYSCLCFVFKGLSTYWTRHEAYIQSYFISFQCVYDNKEWKLICTVYSFSIVYSCYFSSVLKKCPLTVDNSVTTHYKERRVYFFPYSRHYSALKLLL